MPKIYVKNTTLGNEKSIILDTREGLIYPLQFKNWNRVKVAMYYSLVPNSGDDNQSIVGGATETLQIHDVRDRFFLGLKSTQSVAMPGEDGEYFWGNFGGTTTNDVTPTSSRMSNIGPGTIYPTSTRQIQGNIQSLTPNASVTSSFGSYMGVEMNLNTTQPANETFKPGDVPIEFLYRVNTAITNVSKEALRSETLTNSFSTISAKDAVNGSSRPQALFVYWPFLNYRIRIHSIGAFQVS